MDWREIDIRYKDSSMKTVSSSFLLAGVATAVSLATIPVAQAQAQTEKIGFSAPMTGPQAMYGKDYEMGAMLAIDEFNATKPRIDGKITTFVLDSADDQADPKTGTMIAQRLVDDGIKGMLGHLNSGVSIPASAIYAQAGIPQISM